MTALDNIRKRVVVDIDQLDPALAEKLGPFQDMTSNQALIAGFVTADPKSTLVKDVIGRVQSDSGNTDRKVDLALDHFAVLCAKSVLPHIKGRVHAQLSPRYANSIRESLDHAHRLVSLFEKNGIPKERVCLKIPATGAGIITASRLEKEGIRTLATTLFSVDQGLAAQQAGCLYIAPYFNELSVHFEPATWVEYEDTEAEHPMSGVIREIVKRYKQFDSKPLVMPASIVTSTEALAISNLGVDHITIAGKVLDALAADEATKAFRSKDIDIPVKNSGKKVDGKDVHAEDYLADDGKALDRAIKADSSVDRRLTSALDTFGECETKVMAIVRERLAEVSHSGM